MRQERLRTCTARAEGTVRRVRLEDPIRVRHPIVDERVDQRVAQVRQMRAACVPRHLLARGSRRREPDAHRLTGGEIDPRGPGKHEPVGDDLRHAKGGCKTATCRIRADSRGKTHGAASGAAETSYTIPLDGAFSHRRRIARPRARRHSRRHPRRASHRHRRHHRGSAPPAGRVWPWAPDGDRVRPRRDSLRGARWRNDRRTDRDVDRQPRLGELAAHDAHHVRGPRRCRRRTARAGHEAPAWPRGSRGCRQVPGRTDVRDVLERASARETAARVAAGAVARQLLLRAGARITSHVFAIGGVTLPPGTTGDVRRRRKRWRRTPRCAASTAKSSSA